MAEKVKVNAIGIPIKRHAIRGRRTTHRPITYVKTWEDTVSSMHEQSQEQNADQAKDGGPTHMVSPDVQDNELENEERSMLEEEFNSIVAQKENMRNKDSKEESSSDDVKNISRNKSMSKLSKLRSNLSTSSVKLMKNQALADLTKNHGSSSVGKDLVGSKTPMKEYSTSPKTMTQGVTPTKTTERKIFKQIAESFRKSPTNSTEPTAIVTTAHVEHIRTTITQNGNQVEPEGTDVEPPDFDEFDITSKIPIAHSTAIHARDLDLDSDTESEEIPLQNEISHKETVHDQCDEEMDTNENSKKNESHKELYVNKGRVVKTVTSKDAFVQNQSKSPRLQQVDASRKDDARSAREQNPTENKRNKKEIRNSSIVQCIRKERNIETSWKKRTAMKREWRKTSTDSSKKSAKRKASSTLCDAVSTPDVRDQMCLSYAPVPNSTSQSYTESTPSNTKIGNARTKEKASFRQRNARTAKLQNVNIPGEEVELWQGSIESRRKSRDVTDLDLILNLVQGQIWQYKEDLPQGVVRKNINMFGKLTVHELQSTIEKTQTVQNSQRTHAKTEALLKRKRMELLDTMQEHMQTRYELSKLRLQLNDLQESNVNTETSQR